MERNADGSQLNLSKRQSEYRLSGELVEWNTVIREDFHKERRPALRRKETDVREWVVASRALTAGNCLKAVLPQALDQRSKRDIDLRRAVPHRDWLLRMSIGALRLKARVVVDLDGDEVARGDIKVLPVLWHESSLDKFVRLGVILGRHPN